MANGIAGSTKLNAQLEMAPIELPSETKLSKLKQSKSWSFADGSKRGRLEIMAEILLYCCHQKAKTKIMYKTNLNYAQLKKHLWSLTSKGLLATNTEKYFTTQKGHRFLEIFAQLNDLLKNA
jgi:predicted transcriptional regulator